MIEDFIIESFRLSYFYVLFFSYEQQGIGSRDEGLEDQ